MADIIWDYRPLYVFNQTNEERYKLIQARYRQFVESSSDPSTVPIRVFEDLKPKSVEELNLIREVSKHLQIKKDEDIKKSQAADAEEEQKEKEEVKETEQTEAEKTDA